MANKKKKNTGFGVACCLLVALVIFIIFLVQRKTIAENLKETRLFERLGIKTPKVLEDYEIAENAQSEDEIPLKEETFTIHVETNTEENSTPVDTSTIAEDKTIVSEVDIKPENNKVEDVSKKESSKIESEAAKTTSVTAEVKYTDLQLCFVDYGADGIVFRKMIKRSVPKNDSPLTTAIKLLLEGPDTSKNSEKDCLTLIPENTRLLSAKVENGIAYLNFSEDFEFNSFGVDGYRSQLMQVVYTATAFSTVKSVQFLIEGQKKEYLGSEGQRIGEALSRNSF
ncbi:MAG: GerMN domain-containing protein [Treponema sp.]|nr:GerMN domain-containing protein [Treponema sp.]